jgi:hypothetical protein
MQIAGKTVAVATVNRLELVIDARCGGGNKGWINRVGALSEPGRKKRKTYAKQVRRNPSHDIIL